MRSVWRATGEVVVVGFSGDGALETERAAGGGSDPLGPQPDTTTKARPRTNLVANAFNDTTAPQLPKIA